MHPDLERLIRLQRLHTGAEQARRAITEIPARQQALDERLQAHQAAVATARARLDACQTARRQLEKDLAAVQSRLSRFKEQLMEVKTNKEYQAMQTEIGTAEREVRSIEDRVLDRMEEAEALSADLAHAQAVLTAEEAVVADERRTLAAERVALERELEQMAETRRQLLPQIGAETLALFENVAAKRRGLAVAEARDGHCTVCHVRLRPQVFTEVRRNDRLIQCESCYRILYFAAPAFASSSPEDQP